MIASLPRLNVTKGQPESVEKFSKDLKKSVADISMVLQQLFGLYLPKALVTQDSVFQAVPPSDVVLELFDQWCIRSGIVPSRTDEESVTCLSRCEAEIYPLFKVRLDEGEISETDKRRSIRNLTRDLGLKRKAIEEFIDATVSKALRYGISEAPDFKLLLDVEVFGLYSVDIRKFCVQTAHVILSRMLLYRVLEDKGFVPERLAARAFTQYVREVEEEKESYLVGAPRSSYARLLEKVRSQMQDTIPRIYRRAIFDWWFSRESQTSEVFADIRADLQEKEGHLDTHLKEAIQRLDRYDLRNVDRDVWKDVYQDYLPQEERLRLGGFFTPDELVDLILDLVGYKSETKICGLTVLDPACGSGTFLVEAVKRLVDHLQKPMACHATKDTPSERGLYILETIRERIFGLDIHPFAQFLTIVNLSFQVLPHFAWAKRQYSRINLEFSVHSGDALEYEFTGQRTLDEAANGRLREESRRRREVKHLREMAFDLVVGNPPWGGVLRGKLSPLFDEQKKNTTSGTRSSDR